MRRRLGACLCIGAACALLQPDQPESFLAALLLVLAWTLGEPS